MSSPSSYFPRSRLGYSSNGEWQSTALEPWSDRSARTTDRVVEFPTVFLLGRGRTGTTWIGQILNRYPRCHYKYEPFNPGKDGDFSLWLRNLASGDDDHLRRCFEALCA